jgi:hypothetical protein
MDPEIKVVFYLAAVVLTATAAVLARFSATAFLAAGITVALVPPLWDAVEAS